MTLVLGLGQRTALNITMSESSQYVHTHIYTVYIYVHTHIYTGIYVYILHVLFQLLATYIRIIKQLQCTCTYIMYVLFYIRDNKRPTMFLCRYIYMCTCWHIISCLLFTLLTCINGHIYTFVCCAGACASILHAAFMQNNIDIISTCLWNSSSRWPKCSVFAY